MGWNALELAAAAVTVLAETVQEDDQRPVFSFVVTRGQVLPEALIRIPGAEGPLLVALGGWSGIAGVRDRAPGTEQDRQVLAIDQAIVVDVRGAVIQQAVAPETQQLTEVGAINHLVAVEICQAGRVSGGRRRAPAEDRCARDAEDGREGMS